MNLQRHGNAARTSFAWLNLWIFLLAISNAGVFAQDTPPQLSGDIELDRATVQSTLDKARRIPKSEGEEREQATQRVLAVADSFLKLHGNKIDVLMIKCAVAVELNYSTEAALTGKLLQEQKNTVTGTEREKLMAILTELNSRGWLSQEFLQRQEKFLKLMEAAKKSFASDDIQQAHDSMAEAKSLAKVVDPAMQDLCSDIEAEYKKLQEKKEHKEEEFAFQERFYGTWKYNETFIPLGRGFSPVSDDRKNGSSAIQIALTFAEGNPVKCTISVTGTNLFSDRDVFATRKMTLECPGDLIITGNKKLLRGKYAAESIPNYDIVNKKVIQTEIPGLLFNSRHGCTLTVQYGDKVTGSFHLNLTDDGALEWHDLGRLFTKLEDLAGGYDEKATAEGEIVSRCWRSDNLLSSTVRFERSY